MALFCEAGMVRPEPRNWDKKKWDESIFGARKSTLWDESMIG